MIFFLHPIVRAVETVISGLRKINLPKLLLEVVKLVPMIVDSFNDLVKTFDHQPTPDELKIVIDKELDTFIQFADVKFDGMETDMPEHIRDEVIGHVAGLLKCFLYHKAKIEGYYVPKVD